MELSEDYLGHRGQSIGLDLKLRDSVSNSTSRLVEWLSLRMVKLPMKCRLGLVGEYVVVYEV